MAEKEKVLKSIKFPQLPDNYNVPEMIPEYDETSYHYFGEICFYDGSTYVCIYLPTTEYDNWGITGPFNTDYWESLKFPVTSMVGLLANEYLTQYDPEWYYNVGDFVVSPNQYFAYCYAATTNPAGEFSYNNWIEFDNLWSASIPDAFRQLLQETKLRDLICPIDFGKFERIQPEFRIDKYDSNGDVTQDDEFEFVVLSLPVEEGYDYVFIDTYSNVKYFISFNDDYTDTHPVQNPFYDSTWTGFNSYYNGIEFDGGYFQYIRIPEYSLANVDTINIAISDRRRLYDQGEYKKSTISITMDDLDDILNDSFLCFRVRSAGDVDTTEVNKLVQQDYTEVYKNLKQNILKDTDGSDYTDSLNIPLDEGNIALQFINYNNAWDDIDIEIRLHNSTLGGSESINLKNSEKHIYIIDKNMTNNGELLGWDYFKLRFRSKTSGNGYLSYEERNFVNTTLNILRKPKTQSNPNPIHKNNPQAIQEFINVARSFKKAEDLYIINQPTYSQYLDEYPMQLYNIDAATFVESCLKGIDFDNTPYSANWNFPHFYDGENWPEEENIE